jgi:hypothetical protein
MTLRAELLKARSAIAEKWRDIRRQHPILESAYRDLSRHGRLSLSLRRNHRDVVFAPIVGMHRSGTSCITSILARNGLRLSDDLINANAINPEGFWESKEVIAINDMALNAYMYDYTNPGGVVTRFPRSLFRRAERYLLRLATGPVVGWKDPRTTITWPAWHELLYKNRHVVIACFRHPRKVAKSFGACDERLGYEAALECWRKYNSAVASICSEVVFVNFDEPLEPQIRFACGRIGLGFAMESISAYKPQLVHNHQHVTDSGSEEADSLYNHLLARWRAQPMELATERAISQHGVEEVRAS